MSYPPNCLVTLSNTEQCATVPVFASNIRIKDYVSVVRPQLICTGCDASVEPEWDGTFFADFTFGSPGDPPVYVGVFFGKATGSIDGRNISQAVIFFNGLFWTMGINCTSAADDGIIGTGNGPVDTPLGLYSFTPGNTCGVLTELTVEPVGDAPGDLTDCVDAGNESTTVSTLTDDQKAAIQNWLNQRAAALALYTAQHDAAGQDTSGNPPGGLGVSVDTFPSDSSPGSYTKFGRLTIRESVETDFNVGAAKTLKLKFANSRFKFKPATGTITKSGADVTAVALNVTEDTLTITFTVTNTLTLDEIIIDGLEVQPSSGSVGVDPTEFLIRPSGDPGTAAIDNIDNDVTTFASLTKIAGKAASLLILAQPPATASVGVEFAFADRSIIQVIDQFGNLADGDNITVVSAQRLHGTGNLGGTLDVTATAGVAQFIDFSIDTVGVHDIRFFVRGLSNYIRGTLSTDITVT